MVTRLQPSGPGGSITRRHRIAWPARLTARTALLGCGVAASAWWVAMDIVGSLRYPGYSYADQTISELGAEGAPTRMFMAVANGLPYAALMVAFGVGVWKAAEPRRAGRLTGALLATEAVFGFVGGLLFPMAQREVIAAGEETFRNSLHAPYGVGMPILFVAAMIAGSRLFGTRFRVFTYTAIVVLLVFGMLTALQSDEVAANAPTPWLGFVERTNAYTSMMWVAVLSIGLLRAEATSQGSLEGTATTPSRSQGVAP